VYAPVAQRGSDIFFLMRDLRRLNHMYQFSLATFLRLFRKALATDTPAGDTGARISLLTTTLLQVTPTHPLPPPLRTHPSSRCSPPRCCR
jgi:hypothetical protein